MSDSQFAVRAGLKQSKMSNLLNGKAVFRRADIAKIANIIDDPRIALWACSGCVVDKSIKSKYPETPDRVPPAETLATNLIERHFEIKRRITECDNIPRQQKRLFNNRHKALVRKIREAEAELIALRLVLESEHFREGDTWDDND